MRIIDAFPYPFHEPMAQELLRILASQFSGERDSIAFVEQHGVNPLTLTPGLSALNRWREFLEKTAVAGTTRDVVKAARELQPRNPRVPFLDALLAEQSAPVRATPDGGAGGAGFVQGNDAVTRPEALLFFDDLTMPTGFVPGLIKTLGVLLSRAPSVCLLRIENAWGSFFGTGSRISADLVLTNHHVLFPKRSKATKIFADFAFDVDGSGAPLAVVSLPGDVGTIVGNAEDDWAVVRVANMEPGWPILDLTEAVEPKAGDAAYILQHPAGQRKRLGYVRNTVTDADERVVHYLTDTQPGSSGAPVFDAQGRLIALHHAGGEPQEVAGLPPISKNEGILMKCVLSGLKQAAVLA